MVKPGMPEIGEIDHIGHEEANEETTVYLSEVAKTPVGHGEAKWVQVQDIEPKNLLLPFPYFPPRQNLLVTE